jgi:peroxiredoxin Q/BCP
MNLQQTYPAVTADLQTAELSLETLLSFSDKTLLFFYPKDNTPGCTNENKDFSRLKSEFSEK